jgi:hypothetical protein
MLYQRLRGWPNDLGEQLDEDGKPVFSLGRWGLPINFLAVVYGLAMAINLAWPRQDVYDPDGTNPALQYFALIILTLTAAGGLLAFTIKKRDYRRAIGILPEPATDAEAVADPIPA